MSVPFVPKVALKAIKILTEPQYAQSDYNLRFEALCKRIPDQHPILIDEHLQFAADVIKSAKRLAGQVKAGELSRAEALERLEKSFEGFGDESIARALVFALQI